MNRAYPLYDQRPLFRDLRALLADSASKYGKRIAISYRDTPKDPVKHTRTYEVLFRNVSALGTEFLARGLHRKHCALIGTLSEAWIESYLALLSIGAVAVPLDPEWSANDLGETVKQAQAEVLLCDATQEEKVETICKISGISTVFSDRLPVGERIDALIASGQNRMDMGDRSFFEIATNPEALALLVFTSGTTGKGKGVMLSQKALLSNIYGAQQIALIGKKLIGILPPHHTFGSTIGILAPIYIGSELYLSNGLKYFAKEMQMEKPDCLILVPLFLDTFAARIRASVKRKGKEGAFRALLRVSNGTRKVGIDLTRVLFREVQEAFGGNLKSVICGGAPMGKDAFELFTALGIRVMNGYGITECAPLISVNRPKQILPGSAGLPIPNISVRIDRPNENGEGEICVRGPNVMLGYFRDEEATRAVIDENGFFHTGDIGRMDPKSGFLYITGRIKNLIILSNGKNVYPEEIEQELAGIPGVSEVIVYEGQSKRGVSENKIVAEFFFDPAFLQKEQPADPKEYLKPYIEAYNRTAVPYKRIGMIRIRDSAFPKNTLRKVIRFKIDRTIA